MNFHKGLCHMFRGLSRSFHLNIFSPRITASHRMHESTAYASFWLCFKLVHIWVVVVIDTVEESHPTIPSAISLLTSRFCDLFLPGHFCASCAIQEICFCGSLIILICEVERDGYSEVIIELFGSLISESIERSCLSWKLVFLASSGSSCRRSLSSFCVHGISPPHCEWGRRLGYDLICIASQLCWSCHLYWACKVMEWWLLHCHFEPPWKLLMLCITWCWE